ncbi:MAG TPA: TIGR04283 family arsenosugar biosynthesis glycosyltransferase [Vicinamibacterales bacterium]|nr:TIGR04283 family arsenosugar biosynthesis glycosyltransferase [Vicinamibacterales bacterium]
MDAQPFVSIVIPVLEDEAALRVCLAELDTTAAVELIVVDGGSGATEVSDGLRQAYPAVRWLRAEPGRGRQMNAGAAVARGRWLLFLHGDTRLGAGWLEALRSVDGDPAVAGGCFRLALDSPDWRARLIELGVTWRVRHMRLPYGDQALFARRPVFEALGGYAELPLMEDVDFVARLGRRGRLAALAVPATTSARRWERDGWARRSLGNVALLTMYVAGVPPGWLAKLYWKRPPADSRAARRRPD